MIKKYFRQSFQSIDRLAVKDTYTVKGGADFMDGREVAIEKMERHYKLSFVLEGSDLKTFYNSITKNDIGSFELVNRGGDKLIVPENAALVRQFQDQNNFEVNSFYCEIHFDKLGESSFDGKKEQFYRMLIPAGQKKEFSFYDLRFWYFNTDIKMKIANLLKIVLHEKEYHFFYITTKERSYIGIDGLHAETLQAFLDACWAIMSTQAFLSGCFHLDEAYYISSSDNNFDRDLQTSFTALRETMLSEYKIFTTNGASVLADLRERQGRKWDDEQSKDWLNKLAYFPLEVYEKLTELFFDHDSLSRALFIILEANSLALELKAGAYCIAYEGICHTIKKLLFIKTASVIDQTRWNDSVKPALVGCIEKLFEAGNVDVTAKDILDKKINNLNQPTNKDSLSAPFRHFKYELMPYESKAIDNRNSFLHGGSPINAKKEDSAFKGLYFNAITLHKLSSILLLKLAGFSGYIVNYAKIHEHMTDEILEEDGFILI